MTQRIIVKQKCLKAKFGKYDPKKDPIVQGLKIKSNGNGKKIRNNEDMEKIACKTLRNHGRNSRTPKRFMRRGAQGS